MSIELQDITAVDWSPKLSAIGEIVEDFEDIAQCLRIILTTPKGTDPHRPEFGAHVHQYIDAPVNDAIPAIIRESIDAINAWEPRVQAERITASIVEHHVTLNIEWKLSGQSSPQRPIEVFI